MPAMDSVESVKMGLLFWVEIVVSSVKVGTALLSYISMLFCCVAEVVVSSVVIEVKLSVMALQVMKQSN